MKLSIGTIRRVYFDFDGTLVDSNPFKESAIAQSILELCSSNLHCQEAIDFFVQNHGIARKVKLLKFFEAPIVDKILENYNRKCRIFFETCVIHPSIKKAIISLNLSGKQLFILSGGNSREIKSCLNYNGITACFQDLLTEEAPKSDHLLSQQVNENDLIIGDSPYDYNCAKATKALFASIIIGDTNQLYELSQATHEYKSINFMKPIEFLSFVSL